MYSKELFQEAITWQQPFKGSTPAVLKRNTMRQKYVEQKHPFFYSFHLF